jgi:hypothetical protein
MNDHLLQVEALVFLFIAVVMFGLLCLLAYQKKAASAFVVLLAAVLSSAFVYVDHFSEIAATATSLTLKVREASDALMGLRKVAALIGAAVVRLDAQTIVGYSAHAIDQRKQDVLDTLRSIGVDEATLTQVEGADRDSECPSVNKSSL